MLGGNLVYKQELNGLHRKCTSYRAYKNSKYISCVPYTTTVVFVVAVVTTSLFLDQAPLGFVETHQKTQPLVLMD